MRCAFFSRVLLRFQTWQGLWASGFLRMCRTLSAQGHCNCNRYSDIRIASDFEIRKWGKTKTNKHKEFWRDTPRCVSRPSRGNVPSVPSYVPSVPRTFCPLNWNCPHESAQTSRVSLGRPEFIAGTVAGHSDHQIPLCDFSLSAFSSPRKL